MDDRTLLAIMAAVILGGAHHGGGWDRPNVSLAVDIAMSILAEINRRVGTLPMEVSNRGY